MVSRPTQARHVVDLKKLGPGLPYAMTKVIVKTGEMEIQEVNLKAGEVFYRVAPGPLVTQCLTGEIELSCPEITGRLTSCQLLYLKANEPYSIKALSDSTVLIIISYHPSDPAITVPPA